MALEFKTVNAMRLAGLRHVGPYHTIGETWGKLLPALSAQGIPFEVPNISVYHHHLGEGQEGALSDACVAIAAEVRPAPPLAVVELRGGEYATYLHTGPYQELGQAWDLLCKLVEESGRPERKAASFEIYLNDPRVTPPEELLTELYYPVGPA